MWWWAGHGFSGPGWVGKLRDRLTARPASPPASGGSAPRARRPRPIDPSCRRHRTAPAPAPTSSCARSRCLARLQQRLVGPGVAHARLELDQLDQVAVGVVAAARADHAEVLFRHEHVTAEADALGA